MACSPTVATLPSSAARTAGTMPRDTARTATTSGVAAFMRRSSFSKTVNLRGRTGDVKQRGALCFSRDRVLPARSRHAAPRLPARRLAGAPARGLRAVDREHQRTPGQILPAPGQDRRADRADAVPAARDTARGGRRRGAAPAGPLRGPRGGGDRRLGAHRGHLRARGERRGRDALRCARRRAHRAPRGAALPRPHVGACAAITSAPTYGRSTSGTLTLP